MLSGIYFSVLLNEIYYDYLLADGVPSDYIIKVSLDLKKWEALRDGETLYHFVAEAIRDEEVSYTIQDEAVKEREISAFHLLDDGYKKILITMDRNPLSNLENGYQMMHLFDFLLNERALEEA